ncbi:hypothetical protein JZ751_004159 [Albula glossodonta]|uniref:Uncharacterized protein n=1 Tax=Albula glossodonta TaxID=121402 RepID=A0A8T2P7B1_9TELE|nr:hypothetical protein JZ751_004159 [Albula glossodonta]
MRALLLPGTCTAHQDQSQWHERTKSHSGNFPVLSVNAEGRINVLELGPKGVQDSPTVNIIELQSPLFEVKEDAQLLYLSLSDHDGFVIVQSC